MFMTLSVQSEKEEAREFADDDEKGMKGSGCFESQQGPTWGLLILLPLCNLDEVFLLTLDRQAPKKG